MLIILMWNWKRKKKKIQCVINVINRNQFLLIIGVLINIKIQWEKKRYSNQMKAIFSKFVNSFKFNKKHADEFRLIDFHHDYSTWEKYT